jgi:hypothetical protein
LTRLAGLAASAVALAALFALSPHANAAEGPRPGLWKVTTRVSRDGATSQPDSHTSCVTADQLKDPSKSLTPPQSSPEEKCTRTQYEWTGSKLSWRIECNGRMAMKGGGIIDFDSPEHYTGKITSAGSFNGHDFDSTIMIEGERLGVCPK